MSEDTSSAAPNEAIPFPTLTILYLPSEAVAVVEEVSQKYPNMTIEDCIGYFHGNQRLYKKVTIWSQGIDSLWMDAVIARTKELAAVQFVNVVSGGMMHVL
ncbi:MAG TPA: hypothetical protein VHA09_04180 [Nitrososphaera sp.]|nr:hypothetical protein [Nitrososphaera sp.]